MYLIQLGTCCQLKLFFPRLVCLSDILSLLPVSCSADQIRHLPVYAIASGPTNSMCGAAFLSGAQDAVVSDIGGTTMDAGVIKNGFPRQSSARVKVRRLKWSVPFDSVSDYPFIITNLCQNNRDDKRKTTLKHQVISTLSETTKEKQHLNTESSTTLVRRKRVVYFA